VKRTDEMPLVDAHARNALLKIRFACGLQGVAGGLLALAANPNRQPEI
jgi:hypothetical protein